MRLSFSDFLPNTFQFCLVVFATLNSVWTRRFADQGFYNQFYQEDHYAKIQTAIGKLENALQWSPDWPDPSVKLGQVSAVALNNEGQLLVFHRASHKWDADTFNSRNVYQTIGEPPIPESTILVFNKSGILVDKWGENLFHMPHGLTVDKLGNIWVTDVALHQVFKFTPQDRRKPALVLGEKFIPNDDDSHFCKPSAVAVTSSGDFFVADGYCNTRIIKYAADGTKLLQWGRSKGAPEFVFSVPHALTLAEERGLVCVADRERGRVACFRADNGTFVESFSSWLIGGRLFSVAYAPVHGGRLYIVNGPGTGVPARGYVIDFESGRLTHTFAPPTDFHNPHDIVTTPDGAEVYVAELDPYRVYRFTDESLRNESSTLGDAKRASNATLAPAKPTATVESSGMVSTTAETWEEWRGALGGAAGALSAALVAAAGVALLRARNRGRKGVTRRRWEYGQGEFKLRRLLERRRFTRVHSEDSDDEPAPMLPPQPPANA